MSPLLCGNFAFWQAEFDERNRVSRIAQEHMTFVGGNGIQVDDTCSITTHHKRIVPAAAAAGEYHVVRLIYFFQRAATFWARSGVSFKGFVNYFTRVFDGDLTFSLCSFNLAASGRDSGEDFAGHTLPTYCTNYERKHGHSWPASGLFAWNSGR